MRDSIWILIIVLVFIIGLLWGYRWGKSVGITIARIEADTLLQKYLRSFR